MKQFFVTYSHNPPPIISFYIISRKSEFFNSYYCIRCYFASICKKPVISFCCYYRRKIILLFHYLKIQEQFSWNTAPDRQSLIFLQILRIYHKGQRVFLRLDIAIYIYAVKKKTLAVLLVRVLFIVFWGKYFLFCR